MTVPPEPIDVTGKLVLETGAVREMQREDNTVWADFDGIDVAVNLWRNLATALAG
jgi:hypothetical protein